MKRLHLWLALPAVLLLGGCASSGKTSQAKEAVVCRPEQLQTSDRENMLKLARQQGEAMLRAMQKKDYAGFTQFFPPEIKAKFPKAEFDKFESYIGKLEKWEYLTEMETPMLTEYLWKTTIYRKNADGTGVRLNMLFHLSAVKQNGQYKIVGSWFR